MRRMFRLIRGGLVLMTSLLLVNEAGAAGLSVTPISLDFVATPVQALWLSNTGTDTLNAQLRVFAWSQADGNDQLTPSRDLVVSPPMIALQPGQRQLVRVIRSGAVGPGERSYRILVDELPDPMKPAQGLQFVMQFSIPVFSGAETSSVPQLDWRLERVDGKLVLATDNHGSGRAKITDLKVMTADGRVLQQRPGLVGYVLAGNSRRWPITLGEKEAIAASEIQIRMNGEDVRQKLRARIDAR